MDLGLSGRRALITGGTRGIGRATTLALAAAGADVVVCHRADNDAAERLRKDLAALGVRHEVVRADLRLPQEAAALADRCRDLLGGLDVVVNNAGIFGRAPLAELTAERWREVIDTNLTGLHHVVNAVHGLLADDAAVVNVGAAAAWRGVAGSAHFTASKAAVAGFTASLAKELGPRGIRVNQVSPGIVADPSDSDLPPQVRERIVAATALRRLPVPEDVAAAVVFLASPSARSITGATITVDCGM